MHLFSKTGIKPLFRFVVAFCVMLSAGMSCSSLGNSYKNLEGFGFAVDQFHNAMRWEAYDTALVFVSPALADDFWQLTDLLHGKIRIMEYEIRQPTYDPSNGSGSVTVQFQLYHCDGPRLQTKTVREKWAYLDKGNTWQLVQHDLKELMR